MNRVLVAVVVSVVLFFGAAPVQGATPPADVIDLPGGFFPEGIAIGRGSTFYTGSLVDGAIYRGDLITGEGGVFIEGQPGLLAIGMDIHRRSRQLFVAGGPAGTIRVYNTDDGSLVDDVELGPGFINDVILTRRAAYVTNSFAPELYKIPLDEDGLISGSPRVIRLKGDFEFVPGAFNTNGIEFVDPQTLIIVNSTTGKLYKVDIGSGRTREIDTGGEAVNGDGLVLIGRTLYAVVGGRNEVVELRLTRNYLNARVNDVISSGLFDVPTTADVRGQKIYVVNAKFNTPPTPETPYEIVGVRR